MVKLTREERKEQNIYNETLRRAAEGDTSDYVKSQMSSYGLDMPQEPSWKSEPQNQGTAMELVNQLSSTPSWDDLLGMKEQLVGIPAITTAKDENRNMYQYLINEMLRSGQTPRGAQLLDESQIPHGFRRTGRTTFTDPNNPNLLRDLKGLVTLENPGVFNLADEAGGGLLQFPTFQKGWAQGDPKKGEGLGITDWGEMMEGLFTGVTPFKYAKMLGQKIKDSDLVYDTKDTLSNLGLGAIETAVKPVNFLAEQIENIRKKLTQ